MCRRPCKRLNWLKTKTAIQDAVTAGKLTQDKADWLIQGLDKGYWGGNQGGFGFGFGMPERGGFGMGRGGRGFGMPNNKTAPNDNGTTTPNSGTSNPSRYMF